MTEQLTEAELLLGQALLAAAIEGPVQRKAAVLAYQRKAISPGGRPANDSSLARKPGKEDNWVEKAGGLPKYVRMVAHALIRDHGFTTSRAIATAVNRMKRWAVSAKDPKVKAAAAAALVEWNAKRGAARASKRDAAYLELKRERRVRTPEGARRFGKPIGSVIGGFRFMNDTQMDAEFGSRKRRYTYAAGEHASLHESGDIVLSSGELGQYEHDVYASMNDEQAEELVTALAGAINGASTWDPDDPAEEREIDSETGWVEEFETSNGTRVGFDAVGDIGIIFPTTEAEGDEGVAGRGADEHHLTNSEARNLTNAVHSLVYEHRNGGEIPDDELFEDPDEGYEMEVDPASGHAYLVIRTPAQSQRFGVPIGQTVWAPVEPDTKSAWQVGMETRAAFDRAHPPGGFNFPKESPAGAEKSLRRVRTPQGARMFGQPIGSVIRPDLARSSPDFTRREALQRGLKQPRTPVIQMIYGGWYAPPKLRGRVDMLRGYTSQQTRLTVHESGAIADQGQNRWHWEARNLVTGHTDRGVVGSQEQAMEHAELAAQIMDNAQTPLPDDLRGLKRVSPEQLIWEAEPDANGLIYGIEANASDPKWWYTTVRVAGTQDWLNVRNSKGKRLMADVDGAVDNIGYARKQTAKAVKQGEGRLDMTRLAARRPRGTTWSDFSYGLRGRDWGTDRDTVFDANTEAGRREIAERDSRDLGIYVFDETPRSNGLYPLEYQEVLNAVMWSYNTMYPGSTGIMPTHTMGRVEGAGQGTLAWNNTQFKPTRYPTMADKRGMLAAEIRFVKAKWVRSKKPKTDRDIIDPGSEGRYGMDHGHFSGRWEEVVANNPHGWSDDQLSYVITLQHEIGHTIHETVFADPDVTRQFWELLHSLGLSDLLDQPDALGNAPPTPGFNNAAAKLLISDYSGTNIREFMAEVWAEYMLDPEPREVVGLVGDFMARALTTWLAARSDVPALEVREAKELTAARTIRAPGGQWTEIKVRFKAWDPADHPRVGPHPVLNDGWFRTVGDLSSLMATANDSSLSFGQQMDAVHAVRARRDKALRGDAVMDAVPLNDETLDEFVDEASMESQEAFMHALQLTDSVKAYGYTFYQPVNALMRAGEGDVRKPDEDILVPEIRGIDRDEVAQTVDDLRELMSRSLLTDDVIVYRGVGSTQAMFGENIGWEWRESSESWVPDMKGLRWRDDGFVSTATDSDTAVEFLEEAHLPTLAAHAGEEEPHPIMLKIMLPKGTPAISRGERDGTEVLVIDGLEYEIWSTYMEDGHWVADVYVVGGGPR